LAQQYFQQIMANGDPTAQKTALMELRNGDPGMYQQVVTMIEQYQNTPTTQSAPQDPNAPQEQADQGQEQEADAPPQNEQVPANKSGDEGTVK
ncbi:MAG TPA: hypothetical protein VFM18_23575, partial [Methanosarcina sp.]|nr:hypothetical protein [Methanosarcina sp.]